MNNKPRNGGKWTEARFHSFIMSALRQAHGKWNPKAEAKKNARVSRGIYQCDNCGKLGPATLPPKEGNVRRRNNAAVDHIEPVIDPEKGFESWDKVIERMFLEDGGYQTLCYECHMEKTNEENRIRRESKKKVMNDKASK